MNRKIDFFIKGLKGRLTYLPPPLYNLISYRILSKKLKPIHHTFHKIIYTSLNESSSPKIIQIGSADGISGDPIYGYVKKFSRLGGAVLVEPVKENFQRLIKNYDRTPNLFFENVAIAEKDERREFYRIKSKNIPDERRGSLRAEINLKRLRNGELIKEEVQCISFQTLIEKYNLNSVDLLHIDTEGYDFKIIKSINFSILKPKIIFYEHKHLTDKERVECQNLLISQGYEIFIKENDTLAVSRIS